MSNVITTGALPEEWIRVGLLSEIVSIRTDEQASIRVHYHYETDDVPADDADYIVIQNHLLRPNIDAGIDGPWVWIMSDGTDIIETFVVYTTDE